MSIPVLTGVGWTRVSIPGKKASAPGRIRTSESRFREPSALVCDPRKADFYALSAPFPPHNTTTIVCHKLSDKLSARLEREKAPPACGGGV